MFRELKDPAYFRQIRVAFGVVTWPHGQDIVPETVYTAIAGETIDWIVAEKPDGEDRH